MAHGVYKRYKLRAHQKRTYWQWHCMISNISGCI